MGFENNDGVRLADSNATPPNSSSYWVVNALLLGGAYPGAQEPYEHEKKIRALLDAGIRVFVNLMEPDETDHRGRPFVPYDDLVQQLCSEAVHARLPVQDLSTPTVKQMQTILNTIDESIADRRPVCVHCWGGVGRTGTVVGCWLLRHNLANPTNVLEVLMKLRQQDRERRNRMSPETADQQQFVKQWLGTGEGGTSGGP